MTNPLIFSRRHALGMIGAPMVGVPSLLGLSGPAHAVPTDTIKVLYRRESEKAPIRLDPAVDAATRALEDEFLKAGYQVVQPSPQALTALDKGPGMTVTFAANAGFSMLFSLARNLRPRPGSDSGIAEVRLSSRVFIGANVLSTETGVGMQLVNMAPETLEFAERSGMEIAAAKAAATMVEATVRRLKATDPARIEEMNQLGPIADVYLPIAVPVAPPPPPPPAPPPVANTPAPAPAPSPATTPAPAPVAASGEALPPPATKHALVVCISDYSAVRDRSGGRLIVKDLAGVKADQISLVSTLKSIGFSESNIRVLSDKQATSGAVRRHLDELVAKANQDDLVLIAISGHGAPASFGPSGFGLPILSDYEHTPGEAHDNVLNFWELQSRVGNMKAQRTVMFLDTCHSGGATQMMQTAVVSQSGVNVSSGGSAQQPERMASVMSSGRHFVVISAAKADESSLDTPTGGVFTKQLTRALTETRGAQPLERLFRERVIDQVVADSKQACHCAGGQTPVFAFSGQGNMIRFTAGQS